MENKKLKCSLKGIKMGLVTEIKSKYWDILQNGKALNQHSKN